MNLNSLPQRRLCVRWQGSSFTEIVRSYNAPCKLFFRASASIYEHGLEEMAMGLLLAVVGDRSWGGTTFLHSMTHDDAIPRWVVAGRDFNGVKEVRVTFQAQIFDFHKQCDLSTRLNEHLERNREEHPYLRGIDDDDGDLCEQSVVMQALCDSAPLPVQGSGPFAANEWRALCGTGADARDHCVGVYDWFEPGEDASRDVNVVCAPLRDTRRVEVATWMPDCVMFPLARQPRRLNVYL